MNTYGIQLIDITCVEALHVGGDTLYISLNSEEIWSSRPVKLHSRPQSRRQAQTLSIAGQSTQNSTRAAACHSRQQHSDAHFSLDLRQPAILTLFCQRRFGRDIHLGRIVLNPADVHRGQIRVACTQHGAHYMVTYQVAPIMCPPCVIDEAIQNTQTVGTIRYFALAIVDVTTNYMMRQARNVSSRDKRFTRIIYCRLGSVVSGRRLLCLLTAVLGFMLFVAAITIATSAESPISLPSVLQLYNHLLTDVPVSTYLEHGFTCHINGNLPESDQLSRWDYCSLDMAKGTISAIRVEIVDGFSASVDFVVRDGALKAADLILQWGLPDVQHQDEAQTILHWANPPRTAFGDGARIFLPFTSIWQIALIGDREFTP